MADEFKDQSNYSEFIKSEYKKLNKLSSPASFRRRFFACILDIIVLAVIGFIIGRFFESNLILLAWKGRFIGFFIMLIYFTLFNSSLLGGSTLGQQILGLRVTDKNGKNLSPEKSFIRSLILPALQTINDWDISIFSTTIPIFIIFFFLTSGVIFINMYFFFFNRKSKQLLQDIISGSFVVRYKKEQGEIVEQTSKKVYIFTIIPVIITIIFIFAGISSNLLPITTINEISKLQQEILKLPEIYSVTVSQQENIFTEQKNASIIVIAAKLTKTFESYENLENAIALMILENPIAGQANLITISFTIGYDIGINQKYSYEKKSLTVEQWRQRVMGSDNQWRKKVIEVSV